MKLSRHQRDDRVYCQAENYVDAGAGHKHGAVGFGVGFNFFVVVRASVEQSTRRSSLIRKTQHFHGLFFWFCSTRSITFEPEPRLVLRQKGLQAQYAGQPPQRQFATQSVCEGCISRDNLACTINELHDTCLLFKV